MPSFPRGRPSSPRAPQIHEVCRPVSSLSSARSLRRTVAALSVPLLLVLAGCGSNPDEGVTATKATIDDVSVKGDFGEKPLVDFKPPVTFDKTESEVLDKGSGKGDAITDNSQVKLDFVGVNAADGT